MNHKQFVAVADEGSISMSLESEKELITVVHFTVGGREFRAQFDPDNVGIYGISSGSDNGTYEALLALKKVSAENNESKEA